MQAPVPALEAESDRLTAWLRYGISAAASAASASGGAGGSAVTSSAGLPSSVAGGPGGSSAAYVPSSWVSMNPDFQQVSNSSNFTMLICISSITIDHHKLEYDKMKIRGLFT